MLLRTYSIHYRSASHRDALAGLVGDYLINSTQRYKKANKGLRRPSDKKERKKNSGTYWDKKTGALKSDGPAKTNPVKNMCYKWYDCVSRVRLWLRTEWAKETFNKGRPRMGTPRDTTDHRWGTDVPLGHAVLSGGLLSPVRYVLSGAWLTPED